MRIWRKVLYLEYYYYLCFIYWTLKIFLHCKYNFYADDQQICIPCSLFPSFSLFFFSPRLHTCLCTSFMQDARLYTYASRGFLFMRREWSRPCRNRKWILEIRHTIALARTCPYPIWNHRGFTDLSFDLFSIMTHARPAPLYPLRQPKKNSATLPRRICIFAKLRLLYASKGIW